MIGTARLGKWLRPLGAILVVVSVVFLAVKAAEHWSTIRTIELSPFQWLAIAALSLAYGASLLLPATAWYFVLRSARAEPPCIASCVKTYGMAQLAKYVPGNFLHLMGRHMIHARAGMNEKRLLNGLLCEILLMIGAALAILAACLFVDPPHALGKWRIGASIAIMCAGLTSLSIVARLTGRHGHGAENAFALYCVFFAIMAAIIAAIAALLGAPFASLTGGAGILAWLAGFVTPGASAGLGIREAAFVLVGSRDLPADMILVVAALFRLVSFAGDLVCFGIAYLVGQTMGTTPARTPAS